jgi:hypothetical protein
MKRNKVDGFHKRKAFVRAQREQIDSVKAGEARNQFAMRIIWVVLGTACAALGWVLLTILLK